MRVVLFVHSLVSDWNHGNAHFLRGICSELVARGHDVRVYEPERSWSRLNLQRDHGEAPLRAFAAAFPHLTSTIYEPATLDLDEALDGAELVLVHEWNEPSLVTGLGSRRRAEDCVLLFHDTHHRALTRPDDLAAFDLSGYDGVLAYGRVLRDVYMERGWAERAWTWHEAADARIFRPLTGEDGHAGPEPDGRRDLVWIGNWGDDERSEELRSFLLEPARALRLSGTVHGVRYPPHAVRAVEDAGLRYRGWLANADVPHVFGRHRATVHVPRRPYVEALPGIPTIRPFEALACGIPLVSAPWEDVEGLFRTGTDYLLARDGAELTRLLAEVLRDAELATSLRDHGLETIQARHTCAHRVDELLAIAAELRPQEVAA